MISYISISFVSFFLFNYIYNITNIQPNKHIALIVIKYFGSYYSYN